LSEVEAVQTAARRPASRETLTVVVDEPKEWRFPLQNGADATLLPLSKAAIHQLSTTVPRMRGSEELIIWLLPFILFDRDVPLYRDTLLTLYRAGFRRFEAANLSHFELFRGLEGIRISAWHRCFSLNSQTLAAWQELGSEAATLYLEDDSSNIAELLTAGVDIEQRMVVYSPLPVMTTKIRIKEVHANTPLRSDRGETYRVTTHDGLQTISSAVQFSLTSRHGELRQRGCSSFVIDLSEEPRERWSEIMAAFKSGRELPGTTEFNYAAELI
jgi:putative protease